MTLCVPIPLPSCVEGAARGFLLFQNSSGQNLPCYQWGGEGWARAAHTDPTVPEFPNSCCHCTEAAERPPSLIRQSCRAWAGFAHPGEFLEGREERGWVGWVPFVWIKRDLNQVIKEHSVFRALLGEVEPILQSQLKQLSLLSFGWLNKKSEELAFSWLNQQGI